MFEVNAGRLRAFAGLAVLTLASASPAIVGGTLDLTTSVYQYMGKINGGFGATPIGSNWLVTAKHVNPAVGGTFTNPEGSFSIAEVVSHPTADFSLVRISGSLTHTYGYGLSDVGDSITLAGYGRIGTPTATGYSLTTNVGGQRYVAQNVNDGLFTTSFPGGPNFLVYGYDLDGNGVSTWGDGPISGEGGIASGDSGSGWFVQSGGKPMIIAVSSGVIDASDITGYGSTGNYDYGDLGVGAAIGMYSDFIVEKTGIMPVPEPTSMAILVLGMVATRRRLKK